MYIMSHDVTDDNSNVGDNVIAVSVELYSFKHTTDCAAMDFEDGSVACEQRRILGRRVRCLTGEHGLSVTGHKIGI